VKTAEFVKSVRLERRRLQREIEGLTRKVKRLVVVERSLRGLDSADRRETQVQKRGLSKTARRRISMALKKRWAERRKNGKGNGVKT